jgi:hypothetical protein
MKNSRYSEEKSVLVSQESQEQPERDRAQAEQAQPEQEAQQTPEAATDDQVRAESGGKKRKKKVYIPSEEEITPRPSPWPIALAVSLAILLVGAIIHPIILGIGVVLVIASVMGWSLERR